MIVTKKPGTKTDRKGSCRPTILLIAMASIPLTCPPTRMGIPREPKATGDVLATKQRTAAYNGLNPSPTSIAAVIATGAPKPAAPSRNAPKEKPIRRACSLRSLVMAAIESFTISNCPVLTVKL